jgi:hypothetical protein
MKRTSCVLLFITLFLSCGKDSLGDKGVYSCDFIDFRYYNNAKLSIGELANNYLFVSFGTTYSDADIRKFISMKSAFDQKYAYTIYSNKYTVLKFSGAKTCEEITGVIADLQKSPLVEFANYTMKTDDCQSPVMTPLGNVCVMTYSNYFYVKVLDENNLTDLNKMLAETKTEIDSRSQSMPTWFVLKTTKNSKGDALKMANYFYESKRFVVGEPDIMKFPVE